MGLRGDQIFVLFFQSIGIFMSAFFFIQYFIIRRKELLFYAIYLGLLWIYLFTAMPEFFFPVDINDAGQINKFTLFKRPVQYLSSIFYTLFVIYYLNLERSKGKVNGIFRTLIYVYGFASLACFICNFFRIEYDAVYFLFSLMLLPVQIYVLVALFREKIPYSRFIIWGSLITIVGSLTSLVLTILDKTDPSAGIMNFHVFLPAQICILIDMFLYSMALQKKIADNEKSLINAAYQRQQAILLERERIIADLHDDVGGGLSSIRMMSDLMSHQGTLDKNQASFAEKISMTAKDIAQRMHTIIWSLNQENDSLDNFIEYVRQYGLSYFEGSQVQFHFDVAVKGTTKTELNGALRKNMFLIVKEALHNVLKHAAATEAAIRLESDGKTLKLSISDNGKGFAVQQNNHHNGFGNGLRNMQKRAEEVGGRLSFTSNNGVTIYVHVPIR
ncbi:MAG: 7TM diverse intracellular signaling domain-containing protein [Ferruginibacter sp.]